MSDAIVLTGARLFDGERFVDDHDLVIDGPLVRAISPMSQRPQDARRIDLEAGTLIVPGFVDLQVNGGGGVLLNDDPSVEAIRTICAAHAKFGTTALLPTLITDDLAHTCAALAAAKAARLAQVPGFLGVHMEGPHLSLARKGAHDPALIRTMQADDLAALIEAKAGLEVLLSTQAPENVSLEQIRAMAEAGIAISLGHSDCGFATASAYVEAGARFVTHLFNAMSPLGHREPGMVGAALHHGRLNAGIIADGFHVDPVTLAIALRAKTGPGRIFLVTDAMSTIGTDMTHFTLNGREILRQGGRLTLEDGTLAGADIDMMASVRLIHQVVGLELGEALRMASLYPAEAIGMGQRMGRLNAGFDASFAILNSELSVEATWIRGRPVHGKATG